MAKRKGTTKSISGTTKKSSDFFFMFVTLSGLLLVVMVTITSQMIATGSNRSVAGYDDPTTISPTLTPTPATQNGDMMYNNMAPDSGY